MRFAQFTAPYHAGPSGAHLGVLRRPQQPQRPSNENANGLIREYLPKGTEFFCASEAELNTIARRLNNRPRKLRGFQTPTEVFQREILNLTNPVALQT